MSGETNETVPLDTTASATAWEGQDLKDAEEDGEEKERVEEAVKIVLSSGPQRCAVNNSLNQREATFTSGCEVAESDAAATWVTY